MQRILHWVMFFTICFGLGYPTLNRYDPGQTPGLADAKQYIGIVSGLETSEGHWHYRILLPYLAKPIYKILVGRVGTWNPAAAALLVVNSAFCASTALVLTLIMQACKFSFATGMIAAFCYLLNFNVANFQLAGLVDSGEAFFFTCLVLLLTKGSWNLLPVVGVFGGLAKETFVPVAILFCCGWAWRCTRKPWVPVIAMSVLGIGTVIMVRSLIDRHFVSAWDIVTAEKDESGLTGLIGLWTSWTTWITFVWPMPLAVRGARSLSPQMFLATVFGLIGAVALGVWNGSGANAVRPMFNVAGPYVCLAFALGASETEKRT